MRSTLRSILPLAAILAVTGCPNPPPEVHPSEKRVVILFTTDEHSQLFASSPELDDFILAQSGNTLPTSGKLLGGVARRMTVLKAQRDAAAAAGKPTLTLSSGDFSQGSLASAAWVATSPELSMMKLMGYDAVALGNHEFDLTPAALAQAIASATTLADSAVPQRPPLLLSNIIFDDRDPATCSPACPEAAGDDALKAMYGVGKPIAPYLVLTTSNGLRIGVVSSMGVGAGTVAGAPAPVRFWSATATTQEEQFMSVATQVQGAVNTVRGLGVDAVILLGHGGIAAGAPDTGEDEKLAQFLTGVDLVLSGHSHLFTPTPRYMYGYGGSVPVVQPKPYGRNVGKLELVFRDYDPKVQLDPSATEFIEVNDKVAPSTDAAFTPPLGELYQRTVGYLAIGLRAKYGAAVTSPSFLEKTLSIITGTPITGTTPATAGNLWNFPLGKLDFNVTGIASGQESNGLNLDADAILEAVRDASLIGNPPAACASCPGTEIAIQASGPIRGNLAPSSYEPNKALTFADIYHMVPLGGDPTVPPPNPLDPNSVQDYTNALPGYPLVKVNIPTIALRAAFEGILQTGLYVNGDFFPGASGLVVHYDPTRPAFKSADPTSPGWITYMALENGSTPTVLYDVTVTACNPTFHFCVNPTAIRTVATTFYIAGVAQHLGIPLYNDGGTQLTTLTQLASAVVRRADFGAIKDYEGLATYVAGACAGNTAHPGFLPSVYDATTPEGKVPRRIVNCAGGVCQ